MEFEASLGYVRLGHKTKTKEGKRGKGREEGEGTEGRKENAFLLDENYKGELKATLN